MGSPLADVLCGATSRGLCSEKGGGEQGGGGGHGVGRWHRVFTAMVYDAPWVKDSFTGQRAGWERLILAEYEKYMRQSRLDNNYKRFARCTRGRRGYSLAL